MKGPNYRYIYNNLEEEENSISSAYCYMYYNCGVTVSLRISNFKDTSQKTFINTMDFYVVMCLITKFNSILWIVILLIFWIFMVI